MIKVFIDESGNMGKQGDYFLLGAVVIKNVESEKRLRKMVVDEVSRRGKGMKENKKEGGEIEVEREELKFSRMKFKQRKRVVGKIAGEEVDIYYFTAYKPAVYLLDGGVDKNLIYNYFCRLLVERVLKRYGDDYLIVFDKRTESAHPVYLALKEYIREVAYTEFPHLKKRRILVQKGDSYKEEMLQVADVVVGAGAQGYVANNLFFLKQLGMRIMMMDEFPKGKFEGSKKTLVK